MLTGAMIGVVVALVITLVNRRKAKSGSGLPGQLEQLMRGRGPLTLPEVAALAGKESFMGRGQVAQALAALASIGKVRMFPAPPGTPHLKKVNLMKYELITPP